VISLKLGVMTGPINGKNRLSFGGDPVPLFHVPQHYGLGQFRRFISISHTVTGRLSRNSTKLLTPTKE